MAIEDKSVSPLLLFRGKDLPSGLKIKTRDAIILDSLLVQGRQIGASLRRLRESCMRLSGLSATKKSLQFSEHSLVSAHEASSRTGTGSSDWLPFLGSNSVVTNPFVANHRMSTLTALKTLFAHLQRNSGQWVATDIVIASSRTRLVWSGGEAMRGSLHICN